MGYERDNQQYQEVLSKLDAEFMDNGGVNAAGVRPDVLTLLHVAEAHQKGENMVMAKLAFVPEEQGAIDLTDYTRRVNAVLADLV